MSFAKKKMTYIQLSGTLACNIPCGVEREHFYGRDWKAVILDVHNFWEKKSTKGQKAFLLLCFSHSMSKISIYRFEFVLSE